MTRRLSVLLDESVTDTECGSCFLRRIVFDEYPVCSQDTVIIAMTCGQFRGTEVLDDYGNHSHWSNHLRDLNGSLVRNLLLTQDDGEDLPIPGTLRLAECMRSEAAPDDDNQALTEDQWDQLMAILNDPPPPNDRLKRLLRDTKR